MTTYQLRSFDLETGEASTVLETETLIEAPNWTPDGTALLVNAEGWLWRVPLAAPELQPVDTGFAGALNNDHGISPDGRLLAISDKTRTKGSCIYILPAAGGTPRRLTENTPSWWHGWSPDGTRVTYTACRAERFGIYTIPVEGGPETCLAQDFDHADGPDYSADGAWIWFNGERDGQVNLWRVPVEGGPVERMTADASVNWFPHPDPSGQWVLYLAYPPGTEGHPRGCDVELRLLPAAGGDSRLLHALFGGQGTINVPCWAPGGGRFAFVETVKR